MDFVKTWFESVARENFEYIFSEHKNLGSKNSKLLQIGVYTGDATKWLANNVLSKHADVTLHDVDTWLGSPESEHEDIDFNAVEDFYDAEIGNLICANQIIKHKMTSDDYFAQLSEDEMFDFIYIDGHHYAEFVVRDAINSFRRLKSGGVLAFDDYLYGEGLEEYKRPKAAVDFFLLAYKHQIKVILSNYQVWVLKL